MAITKVTRTLLSTGIDDQSTTTAITIDSSERVGIGGSPDAMLKVTHTIDSETAIFENARTVNNGTDSVDVRIRSVNRFANLFITSKNVRSSAIKFGDEDADSIGQLIYDNSDDSMQFVTNTSEAMRIDSSGNVGIGASADLNANLTVLDTNYTTSSLAGTGLNLRGSSTGNGTYSAALTFTNGYRTGHSAIAGVAENADNDVMGIAFFTHASTGGANPTSESMRIDSSGRILAGHTTFSEGEDVVAIHSNAGSTGHNIQCSRDDASTKNQITFYNPNGLVGSIQTSGTSTSYNTSSDYRLKENVDYTFNALDRVVQLKPARFNFIADADTTVDGFIAHEVQDIVPEAISGEKDAVNDEGNPEYQGIDQSKLVPLLTKAIQELSDKVDNQQTIIDNLTTRIETLENA